MADSRETPTFNMKVVVRETGLKPDTLRAWERRYGMPNPKRTVGGHRLYSQHEIDMLKWLIERQEEGLSISHAVDLWQQIKGEGNDPLQGEDTALPASEPVVPIHGEMLAALCDAWVDACLNFNEHEAQHILAQAFARYPTEVVCFDILQKGLVNVGQGWYEGRISVQQEHFASALAVRQLEALLAASPPPTHDVRILIGCPPEELHTFSPLVLSLLLRRRGYDVVYLGANVPLERLETAVSHIKPQLVILSAQTLHTAGLMLPMAYLMVDMQIPFAYGGAVFNYLEGARKPFPGHFLGNELKAVPDVLNAVLHVGNNPTPEITISPAYTQALAHFVERRSAIEADLQKAGSIDNVPANLLQFANQDLGNNIEAALKLCNVDLLAANINWVKGLLMNYHYHMPDELMSRYIKMYNKAAKDNLDARGKPILDWFSQVIKNEQALSAIRHSEE
ncbi:MAG: MerR family transcriptional regulator [Anaerolineales bacterium]|nr:MerR family transcriptional regulator [Anaerolineales bacterium]